jgi:hypothetical protein
MQPPRPPGRSATESTQDQLARHTCSGKKTPVLPRHEPHNLESAPAVRGHSKRSMRAQPILRSQVSFRGQVYSFQLGTLLASGQTRGKKRQYTRACMSHSEHLDLVQLTGRTKMRYNCIWACKISPPLALAILSMFSFAEATSCQNPEPFFKNLIGEKLLASSIRPLQPITWPCETHQTLDVMHRTTRVR